MVNTYISNLVKRKFIRNSDLDYTNTDLMNFMDCVSGSVDRLLFNNKSLSRDKVKCYMSDIEDDCSEWFTPKNEREEYMIYKNIDRFKDIKININDKSKEIWNSWISKDEIIKKVELSLDNYNKLIFKLKSYLKILKDIEALYIKWVWGYSDILKKVQINYQNTIKDLEFVELDIFAHLNCVSENDINDFLLNKSYNLNWWINSLDSLFVDAVLVKNDIEESISILETNTNKKREEIKYSFFTSYFWMIPEKIFNEVVAETLKIKEKATKWIMWPEERMIFDKKTYQYVIWLTSIFKENKWEDSKSILSRKIVWLNRSLNVSVDEYNNIFKPIVNLYYDNLNLNLKIQKKSKTKKSKWFIFSSLSFLKQKAKKIFSFWNSWDVAYWTN